jgi:hypothetical protein
MAARGGSIDQLMSNLGQYYAGGGIVAFNEGDKVEDKRSLIERLLYSNLSPAEQQRRVDLQAAADERGTAPVDGFQQQTGPKENMGSLIERLLYSNLSSAEQRRRAALQAASDERAGISPPVPPTTLSNRAALNAADAGLRSQSGASNRALLNAADADLRSQPAESAPAAPRPPTSNVSPPAPAAATLDPNSLRGLTEAYIKGEFGLSPETERDKAVEFTKKTMGLDALLGEKERRAFEREEMIKEQQANRQPTWIKALQAAGKADPRGGLGGLLGAMGAGNVSAREAYEAQDLMYQKELAQLRDVITDARINGNTELVKQGMAAYKEVDARRGRAATNATSLVATDERTETSKQIAKDNAAARIAMAAGRGAGSGDKQQLNELKALQTSLKDQLKEPRMMGKAGDEARRQLGIVNAEIAKMAGLSTMTPAPGAGSPGGTSLKYNPKTGKIE